MRRIGVLALISVLSFAGLSCSRTPPASQSAEKVVAHGDGRIEQTISLRLLDAVTHRPLAGVSVVFRNREEIFAQRAHEFGTGLKTTGKQQEPTATTVVSDADGRVSLGCRFSASFPRVLRGDKVVDGEPEIDPDGEFDFASPTSFRRTIPAAELFAGLPRPVTPAALQAETTIELNPATPAGT